MSGLLLLDYATDDFEVKIANQINIYFGWPKKKSVKKTNVIFCVKILCSSSKEMRIFNWFDEN